MIQKRPTPEPPVRPGIFATPADAGKLRDGVSAIPMKLGSLPYEATMTGPDGKQILNTHVKSTANRIMETLVGSPDLGFIDKHYRL